MVAARLTVLAALLFSPLALAKYDNYVYLIRHGEKPDSGNGLSPAGVERSECLVNV